MEYWKIIFFFIIFDFVICPPIDDDDGHVNNVDDIPVFSGKHVPRDFSRKAKRDATTKTTSTLGSSTSTEANISVKNKAQLQPNEIVGNELRVEKASNYFACNLGEIGVEKIEEFNVKLIDIPCRDRNLEISYTFVDDYQIFQYHGFLTKHKGCFSSTQVNSRVCTLIKK